VGQYKNGDAQLSKFRIISSFVMQKVKVEMK